jgi:hypothetical protein
MRLRFLPPRGAFSASELDPLVRSRPPGRPPSRAKHGHARILLLAALASLSLTAGVPTPREHFGFEPGDDYKLADYSQITSYFEKLSHSSDRIRWVEFGRTSLGKPMYAAFISAPENLARLDEFRDISRRLALGRVSPEEAHALAEKGRAIVWIDSGLHASEVAPSQHAPELAFRLLTDETPEAQEIRRKVILIQIPCINPDGLDMVVDWYRSNVGSPYELAPLPWLYQKYAGHDNNRDWYMLNLPETRNVTRLLFDQWFPQIVYNQHQAPPFPARIFIPPYGEPLNPNIPASVMEGINEIGSVIKDRLAREDLPGALSYFGFDAWWDGGLRSVPAFHNMHGILTETAGDRYATPADYRESDFADHFENGIPTREPTVFYERPWHGGRWALRDAIRYMLTADMAILNLAAERGTDFLYKSYVSATTQIKLGQANAPFAYAVPEHQWDPSAAREMLLRLELGGIDLQRLAAPLQVQARTLPVGTYVLVAAQPFRGYLLDLMEPQKYPQLRSSGNGLIKRPYDIAGWTLPFLMGVEVVRVPQPIAMKLEPVREIPPLASRRDHQDSSFFAEMAALLEQNKSVRWNTSGQPLVSGEAPAAEFEAAPYQLRPPRVGVYSSWMANIDAGWTEWLLDQAHLQHASLHNADIQKPNLLSRLDVILLPAQSPESILHGWRSGERQGREDAATSSPLTQQRPEYAGGIEIAGLAGLQQFVHDGGWLVAFDQAGDLPIANFPLPVRTLLRPPTGGDSVSTATYYCPGSVLRASFDTHSPLAFGMPADAYVFSSGGQAYESTLLPDYKGELEVHVVGRYTAADVLASGFLSGEKSVSGKPLLLDVRYGKGHVVLFGFRPQFRGQTFGTFRLVLNAIFLAAAHPAASAN